MIQRFLALVFVLGLSACASVGPELVTRDQVSALENALLSMDSGIDPSEARRAAEIAFSHTNDLAKAYEITDPPLIHNTKVNMGLRPRGLCWHWAEDMEIRLKAEKFQTLDVLRAIANADNPFRIDHSTALLAPRGGTIRDAIVLDPWRFGGRLYWGAMVQDTRYQWEPQQEVLARKRLRILEKRGLLPAG